MNLEDRINEILRELNVSRKDFERKLKELREHFEDLIDEETLVLLTAYLFGYEYVSTVSEIPFRKGKVVLKGIVDNLTEPREIKLKNGEKALFASAILRDETGSIKILLWDNAAKLIKTGELFEGDFVKIKGFIRRKDYPVISVRDSTDIEVIKRRIEEFICKILEIQKFNGKVKVLMALNGRIMVAIAAGEAAKEVLNFKDKFVKVVGIQRENLIFINKVVGKIELPEFEPKIKFTQIEKIIPLTYVNLKGRVSGIGEVKKIRGKDVAEIYISDETGRIRLLLFDENVQIYKDVDVGDYIEVFNGFSRIGRDGEIEIHCDNETFVILRKLQPNFTIRRE